MSELASQSKLFLRLIPFILGGVVSLALSSCSSMNDRPDLVWTDDGRQYGLASWYSDHGERTANGEIYNMYAMTAAHPSIALNSIVDVTNRKNGKTVRVRVNDRLPPIHEGRVIDLSKEAFSRLDSLNRGLMEVEVRVVQYGNNKYVKTNQRAPNGKMYLASSKPSPRQIQTSSSKKRSSLPVAASINP